MKTEQRSSLPPVFISLAAYLFLSFLFFYQLFDKVYLSLGDEWCQYFSRDTYFRNAVKNGIFPLWNPFVFCGLPEGLEAVSHFSVRNLMFLFLEPGHAWNANLFLNAVFSGWFMFLLLSLTAKLSFFPSLIGGMIFLCYSLNLHPDNVAFFLLPALFALAHLWVQRRSFLWAFALSVGISYYFLNSNPQFVLYFSLLLFSYLIMSFRQSGMRNGETYLLVIFKAATPFVMALGLSAFHILPLYELLSLSDRAASIKHLLLVLLPVDLTRFIYPQIDSCSSCPELNFVSASIAKGLSSFLFGPDRLFFLYPPYLGILPFFLVLMSFLRKKRGSLENFLVVVFTVILFYLLLNPLFYLLTKNIPILNRLPHIQRTFNILYFATAFLSAYSLDWTLKNQKSSGFKASKLMKWTSYLFGFAVFFVLARTFLYGMLWIFYPQLEILLKKVVLPFILKQPFYHASPDFYENRILQLIQFAQCWAAPANSYIWVPSVLLAGALALFWAYYRKKLSKTVFTCLTLLLIFADGFANFKAPSAFAPDELKPLAEEIQWLERQPGIFRVMPLQNELDKQNPLLIDERNTDIRTVILRPETNLTYSFSLATPEAYRSLLPFRQSRFIQLLTGERPHGGWLAGEFSKIDENLADLMNIKYVITSKERSMEDGYDLVYRGQRYWIFENRDVLERAFLTERTKFLSDGDQVWTELEKHKVDFPREALIESSEKINPGTVEFGRLQAGEEVFIQKYSPQKVDLQVKVQRERMLVLTDNYYPGWKAYLNGKPINLFAANYVFRAVLVPQGEHHISFRYEPASLKKGFWISLCFLLAGFFFSFIGAHKFF